MKLRDTIKRNMTIMRCKRTGYGHPYGYVASWDADRNKTIHKICPLCWYELPGDHS